MEAPRVSESNINIVGIAAIGFIAWLLLKQSGLLKLSSSVVDALQPAFAGDYGYAAAGVGATPATPTQLPQPGLAERLAGVSVPAPLLLFPPVAAIVAAGQVIAPQPMPLLNLSATDAGFAKAGLTTAQVVYMNSKYGAAFVGAILRKITLRTYDFTAAEQAALLTTGITVLHTSNGDVYIGRYSQLTY